MLLGPSLSPLRPSERLRCLVGRRYCRRLLAQTARAAAVATDSVPAVRRACLDSTMPQRCPWATLPCRPIGLGRTRPLPPARPTPNAYIAAAITAAAIPAADARYHGPPARRGRVTQPLISITPHPPLTYPARRRPSAPPLLPTAHAHHAAHAFPTQSYPPVHPPVVPPTLVLPTIWPPPSVRKSPPRRLHRQCCRPSFLWIHLPPHTRVRASVRRRKRRACSQTARTRYPVDSARRWMDRWRRHHIHAARMLHPNLPHSPPPCALARPRRPTPTTVHTTIAYGCTTSYVYASVAMRRAPRSTLRLWVAPRFGHHLCAISSAEIAPPALSTLASLYPPPV